LVGLKKITALISMFFFFSDVFSQKPQLSVATDVSLLRSVNETQRYWAFGQTVAFHFHFTPKDNAYAWLCYYTNGKFSNVLTADAKAAATAPQQITFLNNSKLRIRQISLGWKRYLKGTFDNEKNWNLYAYAGFGLMFGRVNNTQSTTIDSSLYTIPVQSGIGIFKRLTFDIGLGAEFPIAPSIYIYLETRVLLPTTDYPSPYLLVNEKAPLTIAANGGLRVLFD
jgi:hypothetical protein